MHNEAYTDVATDVFVPKVRFLPIFTDFETAPTF